jgi:ubiquinone/menaquinone biosynthesis C-methylase UbiE
VPSDHGTGPARIYDRVAPIYDLYSGPMEWMGGARRRRRVLARATGQVLEAGVGTGLNLEHYPAEVHVTGIDISPRMLAHARRRAEDVAVDVTLDVADVEDLPYDDERFDTATATCVFCSVADPVQGLRELARVTKPEGRVLLLEHVRPRNRVLGALADLVSPLTRRLFGPEVNRHTERNVEAAGLEIVSVRREGVWREIEARPWGVRKA